MKWWPPRWPRTGGCESNGVAAERAKGDAERQLEQAQDRTGQIDDTVRRADELTARSEMFIRQVERSLHLRRGAV